MKEELSDYLIDQQFLQFIKAMKIYYWTQDLYDLHVLRKKCPDELKIKLRLNKINGLEILGPVDSPLLKIKKNFRSRLLIKFRNETFMQKKISNLLNKLKISTKIKLTVDVDPVNFA